MAKEKGDKEFTFAGKKYNVEDALKEAEVKYPHMMYDP